MTSRRFHQRDLLASQLRDHFPSMCWCWAVTKADRASQPSLVSFFRTAPEIRHGGKSGSDRVTALGLGHYPFQCRDCPHPRSSRRSLPERDHRRTEYVDDSPSGRSFLRERVRKGGDILRPNGPDLPCPGRSQLGPCSAPRGHGRTPVDQNPRRIDLRLSAFVFRRSSHAARNTAFNNASLG
jgi:hypothetical protein